MRVLADDPYALAAELGLRVPRSVFVRDPREAEGLDLGTPRLVVKAVSPAIVHKTEAGAVAIVPRALAAEAVADMARRLAAYPVEGFRVFACVEHERSLGRELLLGMRWTEDFGPVVTLAAGGVYAEHGEGDRGADRDRRERADLAGVQDRLRAQLADAPAASGQDREHHRLHGSTSIGRL